ncbi:choline dehydrogenase [Roseibium sp. SCP14]|uniref:choline dehydrogenase n=1 Tax=Roseibium sp. SCP14 TaxID=3141375 RepID=UPI003338F03D
MQFDYIVVGSGSAGAIVAARLAEDGQNSVLLLEAGPKDNSPLFHVPAAMRYAYNAPKYNWNYETEPEPYLNNRVLVQPRGRVLGGSSSINGQLYLRGHPLDYEGWAEEGAQGWSYAEVLPYFQRLETRVDGKSEYQGHKGCIRASTMGSDNPLTQAFLKAGEEAGYQRTDDVNGRQQDGFGYFPKNIADGRRSSTAYCYLRNPPANLDIQTGCQVRNLVIENKIAKGVRYRQNGREVSVTARREIILSAGAFNSPVILMQSGIGPASQLKEHGIDVVHDLPGVGENLMDHPLTSLQLKCTQPVTLYKHLNLFSQAKGAIEWLLTRKGLLASNHFDAVCFIRTKAGVRFPNMQIALFQIAVAEGSADFLKEHAFQLQFTNQRPKSRGYVKLASSDPFAAPRIRYNMLEHPDDVEELVAGLRLSRELTEQPSLAAFTGEEIFPGAQVQSDAEIEAWLRDNCHSSYHPSGTCKLGTDALSVVDPQCRVHGIENLRVADASIMPIIPSANLNCPTMMIGEKTADMVLGKPPLPAANLPYYTDPNWQLAQR